MHFRKLILRTIAVLITMFLLPYLYLISINIKHETAVNSLSTIEEVNNTTFSTDASFLIMTQNTTELKSLDPEVPILPESGTNLNDFIPNNWILLDSIELDFNSDGNPEYIAVIEYDDVYHWFPMYTRILFAILNEGNEYFSLSFQDNNLIRTKNNGGLHGDPYLKMSTDGSSFTTHAYGGSSYRWDELYTYSYYDDTWYLTKEETTYGKWDLIHNYAYNDYSTGIGTRKRNTDYSASIDTTKNGIETTEKDSEFELIYNVKLDDPPTLKQFSERSLRSYNTKDFPINNYYVLNDIHLDVSKIPQLSNNPLGYIHFTDENYVLYSFLSPDKTSEYLAVYNRNEKNSYVVYEKKVKKEFILNMSTSFKNTFIYKDRIYLTTWQENESIISMDILGKDIKTIFQGNANTSLYFEITGDEIIVEVYNGKDEFYSMDLLGEDLKFIGSLK